MIINNAIFYSKIFHFIVEVCRILFVMFVLFIVFEIVIGDYFSIFFNKQPNYLLYIRDIY